jgi:hypothetical protein
MNVKELFEKHSDHYGSRNKSLMDIGQFVQAVSEILDYYNEQFLKLEEEDGQSKRNIREA